MIVGAIFVFGLGVVVGAGGIILIALCYADKKNNENYNEN